MLNQKDKDEIRIIVKEEVKKEINELKEEIKFLPTKDEFYTKMDELMGEVKAMREEQTVISGRFSEHTDSIEDHETRIGKIEATLQPQN